MEKAPLSLVKRFSNKFSALSMADQTSFDQEAAKEQLSADGAKMTSKAASRILGALIHLAELKKQNANADQAVEILMTPPIMRTEEQTARLIALLSESKTF